MGVAGLWDILRPASKTRSLTEIAVKDGFEKNPDGVRGFRIGIDASIWFFHMEYGREGENPHLRTLFFRCATLMRTPFLPLFVFDGPKRPDFKRGKKISKAPNKLIPAMKQIVEAFGFEHRTAPGEAEAELAYLNRIGVIDGILSDDVDNFLFGAITVIRNPSNSLSGNRSNPVLNSAGKDDKNHSWVYELSDITTHPDIGLTRGGLILIGLLSGGDYQQGGLERCGMKTAVALAKCGFGDTLYQAAIALPKDDLPGFLDVWRHEVRHEIMTNSRGLIGRKSPALAKSLTRAFPDIDILLSYVNPITSESMGKPYKRGDIEWYREPDISKLAGVCEFYFEWGYRESIVKRFRTVIWHSAVQRILRRAVLDLDQGRGPRVAPRGAFSTPLKSGRRMEEPCGTPSKMITKYFSTMNIGEEDATRGVDEDEERLIVKIHSMRTHVSTDGLPEYRIEIAPAQLVRLAEHGIQGIREKPVQEWEDDEDVDQDDQASNDPLENMRVWMPVCMVKMVEPGLVQEFEGEVERKAAKKAGKGTGRGRKKKGVEEGDDEQGASPPKAKAARPRKAAANDGDTPSLSKGKKTTTTSAAGSKAKGKAKAPVFSSDEESDGELPTPSRLFQHKAPAAPNIDKGFFTPAGEFVPSPSPKRRVGVKDLTKKTLTLKNTASAELSGTSKFPSQNQKGKSNASTASTTTAAVSGKAKVSSKVSAPASTSTTTSSSMSSKPSKPPASAPKRGVPAPFPLTFFDDGDDDDDDGDEPLDYNDLFSSPIRMPSVAASSLFPSPIQFPPSLFSSPPTTRRLPPLAAASSSTSLSSSPAPPNTRVQQPIASTSSSISVLSSPSKSRSYRQRKSSGSESDGGAPERDWYRMSPKKAARHGSPVSGRGRGARAVSPTPVGRLGIVGERKAVNKASGSGSSSKPLSKTAVGAQMRRPVDVDALPVFEISSESEGEDVVLPVGAKESRSVVGSGASPSSKPAVAAPLVRARERAKGLPQVQIDFIDLT